jgi:hypothetical protein
MNKRDLGRQREDCILVAEADIPHEIQERHFQPWREKRLEMAFPMLPMLKIRTL